MKISKINKLYSLKTSNKKEPFCYRLHEEVMNLEIYMSIGSKKV